MALLAAGGPGGWRFSLLATRAGARQNTRSSMRKASSSSSRRRSSSSSGGRQQRLDRPFHDGLKLVQEDDVEPRRDGQKCCVIGDAFDWTGCYGRLGILDLLLPHVL